MARINWVRMLGGGLIAAIIAFITDGFLHERLLSADWKAIYDKLGAVPSEHGNHIIHFVVFEFNAATLISEWK